jgi:TonB family protein
MNLLLWSVQATLVIAVAALAAQLMKAIAPAVRLAFWQIALLVSLLLPVLRPWQQEVVSAVVFAPRVSGGTTAPMALPAPPIWLTLTASDYLMMILGIGIAAKLTLLCAGLFRLRLYRREARPFNAGASWAVEAALLASDRVASPVTFGFLKPVILLPRRFADLEPALRDPILFHEVLHVRRGDWLFAVSEEILRSLLWFHPAIWYAVREIQLAREETVDREVIETMPSRERYVDALLAIAGLLKGPEMSTAAFFLRRSHLKRRVVSIFREANMSKMTKATSVSAMLAGCAALAISCWLVTAALPLRAAPQEVIDAPGVTVDMNGARLMHRSPVAYPTEAIAKGIHGSVTAQVRLDGQGNVVDATITSGPDELRKAVLQSVLNWHFTSDSANGTRQVMVTFVTDPARQAQAALIHLQPGVQLTTTPDANGSSSRVVNISAPEELAARLPIHVGDTLTPEMRAGVSKAVQEYDEHLIINYQSAKDGLRVRINAPGERIAVPSLPVPASRLAPVTPESAAPGSVPKTIRVGGMVASANLISQEKPIYPPIAKAARVQGTVRFDATIGMDGTVQELHVIEGPPLLVQAAMQSVQKWQYKPTLLNGQPVAVTTTIDVTFTLAEGN